MTTYVALLRAVNVGGTGALPMADLKALCLKAGFAAPRTFLASGNAVFDSPDGEAGVKATLERELHTYSGKAVRVMVRDAAELADILQANPFTDTNPAHTMVVFLDEAPDPTSLASARGWAGEEARLGKREIYIHYGTGMGRSKLRIPAAQAGTARNLNTVTKLAALARGNSRP